MDGWMTIQSAVSKVKAVVATYEDFKQKMFTVHVEDTRNEPEKYCE